MPLSIVQPVRSYFAGDPVFCLSKDGWFIGSAVVTDDVPQSAFDVRVGYIVPDPNKPPAANPPFAELVHKLYGTSSIGIEESVPMSTLVPMRELAEPPSAPGVPLLTGTTLVSMRSEPYRVQLAELLAFDGKVALARLIVPDGDRLTASGAQTELQRPDFLTVGEYESAIRQSYDATVDRSRWQYFPK